MKRILLLEPDKEQGELFAGWLEQEGYEVKLIDNSEEVRPSISKESFDILLMDIDYPEITEAPLKFVQALKKDPGAKDLPIIVLTYKKTGSMIAGAIEAGADSFVLKPFETDLFLARIGSVLTTVDLQRQGEKLLDLENINFLVDLMSEVKKQDFFLIAPVIFNKLIMDKVKTILGEPVISIMAKQIKGLISKDSPSMKNVRFAEGQLVMDEIDKASKGVSVERLAGAFKDYVYAFLRMMGTLTSDIMIGRPFEVLLVEDNPGDVRLVQENLRESSIPLKLHVVEDGVEALAFLRRKGNYTKAPVPDVILLDLRLPRKDGREVLAEIKEDSRLKQIPVVVMTISELVEDIHKAEELNVDAYITKPVDMEKFIKVLESVKSSRFNALRPLYEEVESRK